MALTAPRRIDTGARGAMVPYNAHIYTAGVRTANLGLQDRRPKVSPFFRVTGLQGHWITRPPDPPPGSPPCVRVTRATQPPNPLPPWFGHSGHQHQGHPAPLALDLGSYQHAHLKVIKLQAPIGP